MKDSGGSMRSFALSLLVLSVWAGCDRGVSCGADAPMSCGSSCVSPMTDPRNCGACGASCPDGLSGAAGTCVLTCPVGQTSCDGGCFDLQKDTNRCGGCGNACPSGYVCSAGSCAVSCQSGLTTCNGKCTDTGSDRQ